MIFSSGSLLLYFLFFLSAAKSHSIGLRSGEYGGRNNSIAPVLSISSRVFADLWNAALSIITT